MVRVLILAGESDERVGHFDLDQLPRKGDEVMIPCEADDYGNRIFAVEQVIHIAPGVPSKFGEGPATILRYCEEIT